MKSKLTTLTARAGSYFNALRAPQFSALPKSTFLTFPIYAHLFGEIAADRKKGNAVFSSFFSVLSALPPYMKWESNSFYPFGDYGLFGANLMQSYAPGGLTYDLGFMLSAQVSPNGTVK
jgi:hypothetical protein